MKYRVRLSRQDFQKIHIAVVDAADQEQAREMAVNEAEKNGMIITNDVITHIFPMDQNPVIQTGFVTVTNKFFTGNILKDFEHIRIAVAGSKRELTYFRIDKNEVVNVISRHYAKVTFAMYIEGKEKILFINKVEPL